MSLVSPLELDCALITEKAPNLQSPFQSTCALLPHCAVLPSNRSVVSTPSCERRVRATYLFPFPSLVSLTQCHSDLPITQSECYAL